MQLLTAALTIRHNCMKSYALNKQNYFSNTCKRENTLQLLSCFLTCSNYMAIEIDFGIGWVCFVLLEQYLKFNFKAKLESLFGTTLTSTLAIDRDGYSTACPQYRT